MGTSIRGIGKERLRIVARDRTKPRPSMQSIKAIVRKIATSKEPKAAKSFRMAKKGNKLLEGIVHRVDPVNPLRRGTYESGRRRGGREILEDGQNIVIGKLDSGRRTMKRASGILSEKGVDGGHEGRRESSKGALRRREGSLM